MVSVVVGGSQAASQIGDPCRARVRQRPRGLGRVPNAQPVEPGLIDLDHLIHQALLQEPEEGNRVRVHIDPNRLVGLQDVGVVDPDRVRKYVVGFYEIEPNEGHEAVCQVKQPSGEDVHR